MPTKQELENKMDALLGEVNDIEQQIREMEIQEVTKGDLWEMRQTIYNEIEICADANQEETPFFTYGNHGYKDYVMAEIRMIDPPMTNQNEIYQIAVNAASLIVEWLCWIRTHPAPGTEQYDEGEPLE
jgi:hypothetical protein